MLLTSPILPQPNKRLFTLTRKFEHIGEIKIRNLSRFFKQKRKALDEAVVEATKILNELSASGGWTREKLSEQWGLQEHEQLSVRNCRSLKRQAVLLCRSA